MTTTFTPETLDKVNFWRKYRDPNSADYDMNDLTRFYRGGSHTRPVFNPPGIAQKRDYPYSPFTPEPKPLIPNDTLKQAFLNKRIAKLPVNPTNWKGTRFLGKGAAAMVGLWEWIGPPSIPPPLFTQVAVKELISDENKLPSFALETENDFLPWCTYSDSLHLLKMLQAADVIARGSDEGLGPEWDGIHRKLFLEFCSVGSVEDLLDKRISQHKPFSEKSLWLIFNCLVDGMTAMEYGTEYQIHPVTGIYHPGALVGWNPILHLDIKPDNLFMAHDQSHTSTPIFKFGDFGLAVFNFANVPFSEDLRETLRTNGTEDYFTPEQFTEEWDFSDYKNSQVAGQYSFYTNIWGVAAVMYQLATLSYDPPNHREPFLADWNPILGLCPTYGIDLRAHPYSESFADLIFECLLEQPGARPDLADLKSRVLAGYGAAFAADQNFEPYGDFLQPEPIPMAAPAPIEAPIRLSQLPPLPPSP